MTAPRLFAFFPRPISQPARQTLALLLLGAMLVPAVFAGPASGPTSTLKFSISDATGQIVETQDASALLSNFNPATGDLSTVPVGTPLSGNWSWSNVDVTTGQTMAQKLLTWRSTGLTGEGIAQSLVQVKATGNVDPFMSYSFSVKNNTGLTQNYAFSYGESVLPVVTGSYAIYSDIAGSLTHGAISPVAQLTPTLGDLDGDSLLEIQSLKLSSDGGVSFVNAGVDVGPAQSRVATGTSVFGPVSDALTGSFGPIDYWQFDVAFSLTPGRDAAALSGYAELTPIPEPSAYAVLLGGLTLLATTLRRRSVVA